MTSAVQQSGKQQHSYSSPSPLWFKKRHASSGFGAPLLLSNKVAEVTSLKAQINVSSPELLKQDVQLLRPCWIVSEQVETNCAEQQTELSNEAPCTPAQSYNRCKFQSDETPDSVGVMPSHSLEMISDDSPKANMAYSFKQNTGFYNGSHQSKSIDQRMAKSYQASIMPPKGSLSHNRIQLEVQHEGVEFHKENLLSLSLYKHDREIQKPGQFVSPSCSLGHQASERILATLRGAKVSPSLDGVHFVERKSPSPIVSRVPNGHAMDSFSLLDHPCNTVDLSSQQASVEKRTCKYFGASAVREAFEPKLDYNKHFFDHQKSINSNSFSNEIDPCCTSMQLNLGKKVQQSLPVVNVALSLVSPSSEGDAMCMQSCLGVSDAGQYQLPEDNDRIGKRRKEGSAVEEFECIEVEASPKNCIMDFFSEDSRFYHRKARKSAKKREAATQQMSRTVVMKTPTQCFNHLPLQQNHLERPCTGKQFYLTKFQRTSGSLEMQLQTTNSLPLEKKHDHVSDVEGSPERQLLLPRGGTDVKLETVSKLFACPAYGQMPKAVSTSLTGEPSLSLCPELERTLLTATDNGNDQIYREATDTDWGKFLGLSATSIANDPENAATNLLSYQQRFHRLQVFLKESDEFDRNNNIEALRPLSATARSGYAVKLEARAIMLFLEEVKEINRMKLLNVLGKRAQSHQSDIDAIPYGPKLSGPGVNAALNHL